MVLGNQDLVPYSLGLAVLGSHGNPTPSALVPSQELVLLHEPLYSEPLYSDPGIQQVTRLSV